MLLPTTEAMSDLNPIDSVSAHEAAGLLLNGQEAAIAVVRAEFSQITRASHLLAQTIQDGGTIHYAAAGSSGLQAFADCCELPGTFGLSQEQIRVHMAGGIPKNAKLSGDVEDDVDAAIMIAKTATPNDVFIVLSASGTTPYALAIASAAKAAGSRIIGVANNAKTSLLELADVPICLATPPEIIAGSTRLGAGTAQKAALNIMSSLMGVHLGHVYKGRLVNLIADNEKLINRATHVVVDISGATVSVAKESLRVTEGDVKLAILVAAGAKLGEAQELLKKHAGHLEPSIHDIKT